MARQVEVHTTHAADSYGGRYSTIRSFELTAEDGEGIQLDGLRPMSRLIVHTRHSTYRLVLLGPGPWVSVQGGKHFPRPSEVLFRGTCLEGDSPEASWLLVGRSMELWGYPGRVITSPVCAIEVELDSLNGPF
jgi:hypothetical protein